MFDSFTTPWSDCSLPCFSVHGIFQAGILEWVVTSFSRDLPDPEIEPDHISCIVRQVLYHSATEEAPKLRKKESQVAQSCPTVCDPWTVAHQAPLSMGFSRQEYWSGLPFPSLRSSKPRDWTQVSHILGRRFTIWATREVLKVEDWCF